jgi:hypothetical protein
MYLAQQVPLAVQVLPDLALKEPLVLLVPQDLKVLLVIQ